MNRKKDFFLLFQIKIIEYWWGFILKYFGSHFLEYVTHELFIFFIHFPIRFLVFFKSTSMSLLHIKDNCSFPYL